MSNFSCAVAVKTMTLEEVMVYEFRAFMTPLIIVFGLTGNILVIATFSRMQIRVPCRFNLYVIAIAVAHSFELIINALLDDFLGRGIIWLSDCRIKLKLDILSQESCTFFKYFPEVAALSSVNLLVLFSFDRVLTVYKPLQFSGDRYLKFAAAAIIAVYMAAFFINIPNALYANLGTAEGGTTLTKISCQYDNPRAFGPQYALYMSVFGGNVIPFFEVFIADIFIFIKLKSLLQERRRLSVANKRSPSELRRVVGHLGLTSAFFVITFPLIILILLRQHSDRSNYQESYPGYAAKLVHVSRLCSSIKSIVYTTGFPTYFAFLPSFRKELRCLLLCYSIKDDSSGSNEGSRRIHRTTVISTLTSSIRPSLPPHKMTASSSTQEKIDKNTRIGHIKHEQHSVR
ncbi:hypothetical protein CSKR_100750 [Clonorchis sinensis]|uniref:Uncharacterized protein n=2 Tax=Clonorchis sinensis TaxID=79923 RepID=A0A8T1M6W9_CLOSI|nr:hypothetical protein CSKR_100750 [Clonorchis sinensis]GAA43038.2 peptide (allatostatin/somatostatin)-like receptor [Clonorchis sinensis]